MPIPPHQICKSCRIFDDTALCSSVKLWIARPVLMVASQRVGKGSTRANRFLARRNTDLASWMAPPLQWTGSSSDTETTRWTLWRAGEGALVGGDDDGHDNGRVVCQSKIDHGGRKAFGTSLIVHWIVLLLLVVVVVSCFVVLLFGFCLFRMGCLATLSCGTTVPS